MSSYPHVVRVLATRQRPDYECPWQARTPSHSSGSGVVIDEQRVLTGAHVVADATFVQIQKSSDPDRALATVEAVSHDCDLALLNVEGPALKGIEPAPLGDLPSRRDKVSVVGFPVGGEEISITEGVVSRVEVQRYTHSQRQMLAVTVDAAINKGNSGGPVFREGKVVGIAFQKLTSADNIGEMVPTPIIEAFLDAVREERALAVPCLGLRTQGLENPLLREQSGLKNGQRGVLVIGIDSDSSADGALQVGDALTAIEGHPIANNGSILYRDRFRTHFGVLLGERHVGDTVTLDLVRAGESLSTSVTLKRCAQLVQRSQYDIQPTYFIYGGMVFQPLSRDFLATWQTWWDKAPPEFLEQYYAGIKSEQRREVVVLTQVLADEINVGYAHLQ
jgi:S1-C subfamily serine protease